MGMDKNKKKIIILVIIIFILDVIAGNLIYYSIKKSTEAYSPRLIDIINSEE